MSVSEQGEMHIEEQDEPQDSPGLRGERPERMTVLLVLGRQETLLESALAVRESRAPTIDLRSARMPAGAVIDASFPAVPLGTGRPSEIAAASDNPQVSESFAVRAFLAAGEPDEPPEQIDGASVFANPAIEPFLTCIGDPAVGSVSDVRSALDTVRLAANGLDGDGVAIAIVDSGINLAHLTA